MTTETKTIRVVTTDLLHDTGICSWKFMFDSAPSRDDVELYMCYDEHRKAWMGGLWGFMCWTNKPRFPAEITFNVFKSGEGFQVTAGFTIDDDTEFITKVMEDLPECVLLMDMETWNVMQSVFKDRGISVKRWHSPNPLRTS